jgi:hypothetical protein
MNISRIFINIWLIPIISYKLLHCWWNYLDFFFLNSYTKTWFSTFNKSLEEGSAHFQTSCLRRAKGRYKNWSHIFSTSEIQRLDTDIEEGKHLRTNSRCKTALNVGREINNAWVRVWPTARSVMDMKWRT